MSEEKVKFYNKIGKVVQLILFPFDKIFLVLYYCMNITHRKKKNDFQFYRNIRGKFRKKLDLYREVIKMDHVNYIFKTRLCNHF